MKFSLQQQIRFVFRGSLALVSYGLAIVFLFRDHQLFSSLISVFCFFLAFHFFYLEIYRYSFRYLLVALVLGILITGFILTPQTFTLWIANVFFHGMIGFLAYILYGQTEGTMSFDGFSYFFGGGYVFTLVLSLVYSTTIVNFFTQFPMNCQQLNQQSDKIITRITQPFKLGREKTQDITLSTKSFLSTTFDDLFQAGKAIEISSSSKKSSFLTKINNLKESLITQTVYENEVLQNTICDYTLNLINKKLQSPTIQYPVIFFILFLIYPFLRFFVWILSFLALGLFELLYVFGVYKKYKETREVHRIG